MTDSTLEDSSANNAQDEQKRKKAKLTLIAILVVSITPILAAYTAFFTGIGVPDHTVNNGQLLSEPKSLQSLVSAEFWSELQENKKWRLMLPITDSCNESCQNNMYTTRQVHIRLGEKSVRVERFAINAANEVGQGVYDALKEEHPLLKLESVDPSVWKIWAKEIPELYQGDQHVYLLIDQEGIAMMAYTTQHGNDLLKDIKRALKYSIDFQ